MRVLISLLVKSSNVCLWGFPQTLCILVPRRWNPQGLDPFMKTTGTFSRCYVFLQTLWSFQTCSYGLYLLFAVMTRLNSWDWYVWCYFKMQDITLFWRRRGGSTSKNLDHNKWCQSVQLEPDVISMSFIPISSLLSGVHGSGFLSHAINLYLRCEQHLSSSCN